MPSTSLQTVLSWPLEQVLSWLDGHVIGEAVDSQFFNWELLAFTAASRAREERSVPWAHLALTIYGALSERAAADERHTLTLSAMNLRGWMIAELGEREGDTVLDLEHIVSWFWSLSNRSIDEVVQIVSEGDWSRIPVETLLELRYVKSALNVLSFVQERGVLRRHPELEAWLQFRSQLP